MNNCETRTEGDFKVVSVQGEVDLSWSTDIRNAILNAMNGGSPVLVDLSQVEYIDSSGIAALVEGYQTSKGRNLKFGLVDISQPVQAVLQLARLDQVFPIYDDLAAAQN